MNWKYQNIVILPNIEAANFNFGEFMQFVKAEIDLNQNSEPSKHVKMAVFETLKLPKLISRKI